MLRDPVFALHEFMTSHRSEILEVCNAQLAPEERDPPGTYLEEFFDELLRAVRRDAGVRESWSPLPGSSHAAARFGADRQRAGLPVTKVLVFFAAISQALGKVGEKYELTISAEEYQILNRCLDAGLATSIENFWLRDKARENQRITESFGFMVHELRNALGNANMAFKLLRRGDLNIHGHTGEVLARNLMRMEALIAQCMGRVQLEVGALPELSPVRIASVLRNLEASAIPDRGVTIQLESDEQLFIAADEMLLSSAIGNLLNNAIKFSPPKSVVRLSVCEVDGRAHVEVADHCGGLNHEHTEELFEPYVSQREGAQKGNGLGLAITKRAVDAMQGQVGVVDHPGHGCVFFVDFPLLRH
jgi:signal transduction histidine kinase